MCADQNEGDYKFDEDFTRSVECNSENLQVDDFTCTEQNRIQQIEIQYN